jgi:hypothetical protein
MCGIVLCGLLCGIATFVKNGRNDANTKKNDVAGSIEGVFASDEK